MSKAWNVKQFYTEMKNKIKGDVDSIYADLEQMEKALDAFQVEDKEASAANGKPVACFSGRSAKLYFKRMKDTAEGYFSKGQLLYENIYTLCDTFSIRAMKQAAADDKESSYAAISKWLNALPNNKKWNYDNGISIAVDEDVINISKNIYELKDNLDKAYSKYVNDLEKFVIDIKAIKKYIPSEYDKQVSGIIKKIESRIKETSYRKRQINSYISDAVSRYLFENNITLASLSSVDSKF